MKDYRIAYVTSGHAEYADEIWEILSKKGLSQGSLAEFNHLDFVDCFILAGADIKTRIEDEIQVEVFIDPESKPDFVARLSGLIAEKYAYLKHHKN